MYELGTRQNGQSITLSDDERRRHIYIVGKTGTGKSTLLRNLMLDDFRSGRGFCLIDPHGDLAYSVVDSTPPNRLNDIVYFDPLDPSHVVGFNPLTRVPLLLQSPHAAQLVSAFKHVWSEFWGPRLEYILKNVLQLLLSQNSATLLNIPRLLVDDAFREKLLTKCEDHGVRFFWEQEFNAYPARLKAEAISPLQNKAGQFRSDAILRSVVGQPSTISIPHILNNRRILIANLSKRMGTDPSHLLGAFLTTAFGQAAEERAAISEEKRLDFTLYVDEFQNFTSEAFATILSEARKWRLNLVIANQFLGQLPDILRRAVLGNVGTLVVFRVGAEDAPLLASELDLNPKALTDTPDYEAWVKLVRGGTPSSAMSFQTVVAPALGRAFGAVLKRTHARHARLRADVERRIEAP